MIAPELKLFFDAEKVKRALDRGARRGLARYGGFVRTVSRRSIKNRRKSSAPGKPPSSHTGLLRRFIFFFYDLPSRSVVIGPTPINSPGEKGIPERLEKGGTVNRGSRSVYYPPRPYMGPAAEEANKRLKDFFEGVV